MCRLSSTLFVFVLCVSIAGCSEKQTAKVKEATKSATDAAGDAAESATKAAQDATSALGESFAAATEQATAALKDVAGGPELMKKVTDLFGSAQTALSNVKDEASAQASLPSLDELIGSAGGLSALTESLPAEAKAAVSSLIESGIKPLQELVAKIMAIPGVESVIKPKVDELMAKLTALASKPQ